MTLQIAIWMVSGQQYNRSSCRSISREAGYKSKIKDKPLWIKDCNQTENGSQWTRSGTPGQRSNLIFLLNLRLQQDSSKSTRRKGLIRVENDRHLLEQLIALGCTLGKWNKHSWQWIRLGGRTKKVDRNSSVGAGRAQVLQRHIRVSTQHISAMCPH